MIPVMIGLPMPKPGRCCMPPTPAGATWGACCCAAGAWRCGAVVERSIGFDWPDS